MSWLLRGLAPPPPSERRLLPGKPESPVQAALRLLDSHAAALAALTVRSPADFRPLPVLAADRAGPLSAALLLSSELAPSLLESLAALVTSRIVRLKGRLRRRLGRVRTEVPLAAVREMDPSCLRHNTRRPGRTLIEKAGARQTLRAVVRVERFDTMENRVLVTACRRMMREARELLDPLPRDARRDGPRARPLLRLVRAASALLSLPELTGITRPRPGERPSFALLKDPDYRAVYRALRLLRAQEERFAEEWEALDAAWRELLLLMAWALIDAAAPGAAVPFGVRVLDRRHEGRRLIGAETRRWLLFHEDYVEGWEVHEGTGGPSLIHRIWLEGDEISDEERLDWPLGTEPSDRHISLRVEQVMKHLGLVARTRVPEPAALLRPDPEGLALSALNSALHGCAGGAVQTLETTAAMTLEVSGEERPLVVFGTSATLARGAVIGPRGLHREHASHLGGLIASRVDLRDAQGPLALVVPDSMSEVALRALRDALGPCWAVWHTVAVALSLAELRPDLCQGDSGAAESRLLVIALSAASCDLAVLGCTGLAAEERLFIRRPRHHASVGGIEQALLDAIEPDERDAFRAAWLRAPDQRRIWVERIGPVLSYARCSVPDVAAALRSSLEPALRALLLRAGPIRAAVLCGGPSELQQGLRAALPEVPCVILPPSAAVDGGRLFLERHGQDLPTWEEELPALRAHVREQGRYRHDVDLIAAGERVRPGQKLSYQAERELIIPPDQDTFDLPLLQGDDRSPSFWLHYAGRPLPLRKKVTVQVRIDCRYGFDGLRGELRAISTAPFVRIPFELRPPDQKGTEVLGRAVAIPKYMAPPPPSESEIARITESVSALRRFIKELPFAKRRDAKKNPGLLAQDIKPFIRNLDEALKAIRASGLDSMPPDLRRLLTEDVGPLLEWLAGIAKSNKDGEPIALPESEKRRVFTARSRTRIRKTLLGSRYEECIQRKLADADLNASERKATLMALGSVIDGQPDALWDILITPLADLAPECFRGQVWGMRRALIADPRLAPALSAAQAERALSAICAGLDALPAGDATLRSHFAIALQTIPHLCRTRESGNLMPETESERSALGSSPDFGSGRRRSSCGMRKG